MEVTGAVRKIFIESWEATKDLRTLSEDQLEKPSSEGTRAIREVKPIIKVIPGTSRTVFTWPRIEAFDLRTTLGCQLWYWMMKDRILSM